MSTIDPGIEDGIKQTAENVDPDDTRRDLEEEEREDFEVPNRWWFASVGCPLLAGTLGPIASAFNIIAIVQHWRQTVPPGKTEFFGTGIQDPSWVIALNVVSLFFALVGNASLLLNMAKRVKFAIAQPVTIVGFFLAGIFLIADISALGGSPHYDIADPQWRPDDRHALTQAFYYAVWAAFIYMSIAMLMCFTVYGALMGQYGKEFNLTLSQRSLMMQTMAFVTYLLFGALVYCHVEGWKFVNAVYWADVTVLTVGLGDFSPQTKLGRGLLFPFAIGGVLILGLVIGSIRSLVLERGRQKMSARMFEKRRSKAVHNVDEKHQYVKISTFAKAPFSTDPAMSPAQKREQEFDIMRKVQEASATEKRYFALANSAGFALFLWLVGALVFMKAEHDQGWTYFDALYFSYTSLMTIGYGDLTPGSDTGKAFFVLWSLLAIPSLTILISNMGDTIVKWVSDLTDWVGKFTVLPGDEGFRASLKEVIPDIWNWIHNFFGHFSGPGIFGLGSVDNAKQQKSTEYENRMLDSLAERLNLHVDGDELSREPSQDPNEDQEWNDIQFYHYVLARECRNLQKDVGSSPPKQYAWADWEYYLKLMGDESDPVDYPGQKHPDILVPDALRAPDGLRSMTSPPPEKNSGNMSPETATSNEKESRPSSGEAKAMGSLDGNVDRKQSVMEQLEEKRKQFRKKTARHAKDRPRALEDWSWLSNESPLLSNKSETDWILERLSAALERELGRQRKGYRTKPPITLQDARRSKSQDSGSDDAETKAMEGERQQNLEKAAKHEK